MDTQRLDPRQKNVEFLIRVLKLMALKLFSCRWLTALLYDYCKKRAVNPDTLINGQSRGFRPLANTAEFLQQFRQQPSNALLRLLARRWRQQITASPLKKIVIGRRLGKILGVDRGPTATGCSPCVRLIR